MEFCVGDKIVHPRYGPGRITDITSRDMLDGAKSYYVIAVPAQGLTVQLPVGKADELGVRMAMSQARLSRLLGILRGQPRRLPEDHRERQDRVYAQLRTGRAVELARVVRDLTGHQHRAHLTAKDAGYLQQGRDRLAAEMALVSGGALAEERKRIDAAVAAGRVVAEPTSGQ